MTKKSVVKALICAVISSALIVSASASANAGVCEDVPIKAVLASDHTDTYEAYMNGEIEVDENSGVGIPPYSAKGSIIQPSGSLPPSYQTKTTPIRSQGSNNTCWAFSGLGTLEAALSHQGKGDVDLSEQHLAWWATLYYNENDGTGWLNKSLSPGGYSKTSAGYLASWEGPKLESDLPYHGSTYPSGMKDYNTQYYVTGIKYVRNDIQSIKSAIYEYGAVATSYNNGTGYNNNRAVYYNDQEVYSFSGHAVTVIGWDDDYSMYNFNQNNLPPANGAWLAKNSWGTNVGDNGYLWISYYDKYAFSTETWGENYAVTAVKTVTPYHKLYQNEHYGATYYAYITDDQGNWMNNVTFANVFDFDQEHRYLESIIFETKTENINYTAYYIPVENGRPVNDESQWTFLTTGTADGSGYVRIEPDERFDLPVGVGAIGVKLDAPYAGGYSAIGVDEWLTKKDGDYLFRPDPKKGDSFVIANAKVYDLLDVYAANNDDVGGTLVIKAVAATNIIGDVDFDSKSTSADSLRVLRKTVGLEDFDEEQEIDADVNFDGNIDTLDALMILRKTVGIFEEY